MSEIQNLLNADADNIKNCKQLFHNFSPELSQTIEDGAQLYITFLRILSKKFRDDENQSIIKGHREEKAYIEKELAKDRIWSRRARAALFLLSYRSYMWAATDLYRTRVTSSMNHLRQQIEASFYMNLILNKPSVAKEWFVIRNKKEGKKFFKKYSVDLSAYLERFQFANTYNRISGAASHARLSSIMYGLEINSINHDDKYVDIYTVKMQEVDQDRPEQFILNILAFLSDQQKLFNVFLTALPEIDDLLLRETRIPLFKDKISGLFALFQEKFPVMVKNLTS